MAAPDVAIPKPNSILKKEPTFKTPPRNQAPSKAPVLPSRNKTDASCSPPMLVRRAAHHQPPSLTKSNAALVVPTEMELITEQSISNQQIKTLNDPRDRQIQPDEVKSIAPISDHLAKADLIEIEGNQAPVVSVPASVLNSEMNHIYEETGGTVEVNKNKEYIMEKVASSPAMVVQEIIRELDAIPLPVSRHGSSKRRSKVKVDSGQQTTPKLQRSPPVIPPDVNADKKEENKTTAFK